MLAILAEDSSDADAVAAIARRSPRFTGVRIRKKGFSGCGELIRKGASHLNNFARQGADAFIVCHDADGPTPDVALKSVRDSIIKPSDVNEGSCIVVPVEEIEAWFIADPSAITSVIPTLSIRRVSSPEKIHSPKEWLIRESRRGRSRPLYVPRIHNPRVAEVLDLDVVGKKCASIRALLRFCKSGG